MMVLLDTEFTSFIGPELLSLGMATAEEPPDTFYAEVDLTCDAGKGLVARSSDMVREGVLSQWGRVQGTACTPLEIGRLAGEWLLGLHERINRGATGAEERLYIGFDYPDDYALMEYAISDAGLWDRVREVVSPAHINEVTGTREGAIAAEKCYEALKAKGLRRHHALADALALRAAHQVELQRLMEGSSFSDCS